MKLSIIVPVYGVEKYIAKCIASLLSPHVDGYEVLVVDDGTKDRSIEIVEERFSDPRIRIIHQENAGLSAARNRGILEAKGDYVWFFDSDDWAETERIPAIIDMLCDCEALALSHYYIDKNPNYQKIHGYNSSARTGLDLMSEVFMPCAPYYLYKKKFLVENDFFFEKGILHEDDLFTSITLPKVRQLKIFDEPVYHHYMREGSITHIVTPKRIDDIIYILKKLLDYGEVNIPSAYKYKWGKCVVCNINGLLYLSHNLSEEYADIRENVENYVNGNRQMLMYLLKSKALKEVMWAIFAILLGGRIATAYNMLYKIRYGL